MKMNNRIFKVYRVIKIEDLQTDLSYQSPIDESIVKKIVNNFDENALGTITISQREDGTLWILDGQHRTVGCRRLGLDSMNAKVLTGLSIEEEANLYKELNNSKKKSPNAIAKAMLRSGDVMANEIYIAVTSIGMEVDYELQRKSYGSISAYKALESIYKKYGVTHLINTLDLIKHSFGKESKNFKAFIMEGFATFLDRYEDVDLKHLIKRLKTMSIEDFEKETRKYRAVVNSIKKCPPYALVDIYNHGLRSKPKLDKQLLI